MLGTWKGAGVGSAGPGNCGDAGDPARPADTVAGGCVGFGDDAIAAAAARDASEPEPAAVVRPAPGDCVTASGDCVWAADCAVCCDGDRCPCPSAAIMAPSSPSNPEAGLTPAPAPRVVIGGPSGAAPRALVAVAAVELARMPPDKASRGPIAGLGLSCCVTTICALKRPIAAGSFHRRPENIAERFGATKRPQVVSNFIQMQKCKIQNNPSNATVLT